MPTDPLADLLDNQRAVILDGGLATELEARGHDLSDELWSARLLIEAPGEIQRLHLDYLEAGADCVVSASYQASFAGFARSGLGERQSAALLRRSVELARRAREEFWARPENRTGRRWPLVAGSVGPYGAFLANGAEYTGEYDLDADGLRRFHARRLAVLADAGADLLACETIPSAVEAGVLVDLLEEIPRARAWMSFSCRDAEQISDGTPLASAVARIANSDRLLALGVNCTAPRGVQTAIGEIRRATRKPVVIYPNSGESYDAATGRWSGGDDEPDLAGAAPAWVEAGARLVGGCCRTGPRDISDLRRRLLTPPAA